MFFRNPSMAKANGLIASRTRLKKVVMLLRCCERTFPRHESRPEYGGEAFIKTSAKACSCYLKRTEPWTPSPNARARVFSSSSVLNCMQPNWYCARAYVITNTWKCLNVRSIWELGTHVTISLWQSWNAFARGACTHRSFVME